MVGGGDVSNGGDGNEDRNGLGDRGKNISAIYLTLPSSPLQFTPAIVYS